jgi:hypothetical protein
MGDLCDLHAANGSTDVDCEENGCPFWRVVEHVTEEPVTGCAIKHYQLLGNDGLAAWLLSVKQRIERLEHDDSRKNEG